MKREIKINTLYMVGNEMLWCQKGERVLNPSDIFIFVLNTKTEIKIYNITKNVLIDDTDAYYWWNKHLQYRQVEYFIEL